MPDLTVAPLGALFGPDFITITVDDATSGTYNLEVFPDANNPQLKANQLPMQFYYMPQSLYLAKKQDSDDFDFSVTIFKGLMTSEDTLNSTNTASVGGEIDAGGAFVTFSTTMAVPSSVLSAALAQIKAGQVASVPANIADHCRVDASDPAPLLGCVPIAANEVTIEVPQLPGSPPPASTTPAAATASGSTPTSGASTTTPAAGSTTATAAAPAAAANSGNPWFISAQGMGHGSIDASSVSSFLVTCGQDAAGAIAGSLQAGMSPFTVHYNLTLMFYMNACQIQMHVDVDKVFTQLSAAAEAKFMYVQADLSANYQSSITNGGITTIINENGVAVDADLKKMIDTQVGDMQTKAWDLVKNEIFNWQPKPDTPATASTGACGGAAVSLKVNYQMHAVHFDQSWTLNDTVTRLQTASGTLTELEPAIKANLNKYLAIVDIGQFFQKLQIAATPNIDFSGTAISDPITSASIEVSYPEADNTGNVPTNADGTPVLRTLGEGFHYTPGNINQSAPISLASWSKNNPTDIINISFLRLLKSPANWNADQVTITKKLEYDPDDPRVDLSTGTTEIVITSTGSDHTPVVSPADVGYVSVRFALDRPIAPNITVTLTINLAGSQGSRTDTLTFTSTGPMQKPTALWQVFSDKYFDAAVAQVQMALEVAPPPSNFGGTAVTWSGTQAVPVGLGRIKNIPLYVLTIPPITDPTQSALVGQYITQTLQQMAAVPITQ
ncbi:MAG: hypothetical protein WBE79_07520 [Candidatus Cybelea sp.]